MKRIYVTITNFKPINLLHTSPGDDAFLNILARTNAAASWNGLVFGPKHWDKVWNLELSEKICLASTNWYGRIREEGGGASQKVL